MIQKTPCRIEVTAAVDPMSHTILIVHTNICATSADFLVNDFCRDWSAPEAVKSEPVLPPSSSPQVVDLTILDRLKAEANPAQYKEEGVVDLVRWLPDPVISKCKKILQPKR